MTVFDRYAPFIQDFIYQNGWDTLRPVQTAAGDAIFNTDENVLLCASTASGKTEAAFFPILTLLSEDPPDSVGALYIGPLKALINDQFSRLTELCEGADLPVWHWHGDVSASHKKKLIEHPSGILQITPESLEALLLRKHALIPKLFLDLRFVVIDEVHSLMRGDRGGQTLCLLGRLSRLAGVQPRRIGLSATIGDLESAGRFLSEGSGRGCVIPRITGSRCVWNLSVDHFFVSGKQAGEMNRRGRAENQEAVPTGPRPADAIVTETMVLDDQAGTEAAPASKADLVSDRAPENADPGFAEIFEHTRGRKCLVFCNSREEAETVTATLRQYCEARKEPDRFLIHHGNLSASYRQGAEERMKEEDTAFTTVTTSTLELGIDIGRLERAFQLDAPFTVSSFLQRMGRTGRRGLPPEMWFVIREEAAEPRAMLPENVPWKLLQAIALIQCYLEERWIEPQRLTKLPFSLLYHQTMSVLYSGGEMLPSELAERVLTLPPFHRIRKEDYAVLLRHLLTTDQIQRTERGGLIVGLAGERVVNNFRFYGVFQESEEYSVRCESEELGTIAYPPAVGDKIALAGRVWVVEETDRKRKLIYCHPVRGVVPAYFGDVAGDINTHILERMRRVLKEDRIYPYLQPNAAARLGIARHMADNAGLLDRPLLHLGGGMWALFPWLGTYAFLALERFLKIRCGRRLLLKGFDSARPWYMQFTMGVDENQFYDILFSEADRGVTGSELLYPKEVPVFEKYDEYVPDELIRRGFAEGVLDTEGMLRRIHQWGVLWRQGQLTKQGPVTKQRSLAKQGPLTERGLLTEKS